MLVCPSNGDGIRSIQWDEWFNPPLSEVVENTGKEKHHSALVLVDVHLDPCGFVGLTMPAVDCEGKYPYLTVPTRASALRRRGGSEKKTE